MHELRARPVQDVTILWGKWASRSGVAHCKDLILAAALLKAPLSSDVASITAQAPGSSKLRGLSTSLSPKHIHVLTSVHGPEPLFPGHGAA